MCAPISYPYPSLSYTHKFEFNSEMVYIFYSIIIITHDSCFDLGFETHPLFTLPGLDSCQSPGIFSDTGAWSFMQLCAPLPPCIMSTLYTRKGSTIRTALSPDTQRSKSVLSYIEYQQPCDVFWCYPLPFVPCVFQILPVFRHPCSSARYEKGDIFPTSPFSTHIRSLLRTLNCFCKH